MSRITTTGRSGFIDSSTLFCSNLGCIYDIDRGTRDFTSRDDMASFLFRIDTRADFHVQLARGIPLATTRMESAQTETSVSMQYVLGSHGTSACQAIN